MQALIKILTVIGLIALTSCRTSGKDEPEPVYPDSPEIRAFAQAVGFIEKKLILKGHNDDVIVALWSPDGDRLATFGSDKSARIWNALSGELLFTLKAHWDINIDSVAWNPDGSRLATASIDKTVKIWNANKGEMIKVFNDISSPTWSPDGRRLAATSIDNTVNILNTETDELLLTLDVQNVGIHSVVWSPDSKQLVTIGKDNVRIIWDTETGEQLVRMKKRHRKYIDSIAWSPDGNLLVTASNDRTARIWDSESGRMKKTLRGHKNYVRSANWSPDGLKLVTASWDSTVKIWNAESWKLITTLKGHRNYVNSVEWSPDGSRLATASSDNTIIIWDMELKKIDTVYKDLTGSFLRSGYMEQDILATPYALSWKVYRKSGIVFPPEILEIGMAINKSGQTLKKLSPVVATILQGTAPWSQAVNALVNVAITEWLNLIDTPVPPEIPQPAIPKPVRLIQEQWETNEEFESRVDKALEDRRLEFEQLQAKYIQDVDERNDRIKALQELRQERINNVPQVRAEYLKNLLTALSNMAVVENATLDEANGNLYLVINLSDKEKTPLGTFRVENPYENLIKQALIDPSILQITLDTHINHNGSYGFKETGSLKYGSRTYTMHQTSESNEFHTNNYSTDSDDYVPIVELSDITMQETNLVDSNSVGSIIYKDGNQKEINLDKGE